MKIFHPRFSGNVSYPVCHQEANTLSDWKCSHVSSPHEAGPATDAFLYRIEKQLPQRIYVDWFRSFPHHDIEEQRFWIVIAHEKEVYGSRDVKRKRDGNGNWEPAHAFFNRGLEAINALITQHRLPFEQVEPVLEGDPNRSIRRVSDAILKAASGKNPAR